MQTTMPQHIKVGFIGLGIMGSRMAANLLAGGCSLSVHNRRPDKAEELAAAGATVYDTPRALAREVDLLFTMLSTPEAVTAVAEDDNGFLPGLGGGALWVDCSTVHPSFSRSMAAKAAERGVSFLDAPVAGTKGPAESGELVFFVGGRRDDVDRARPFFDCMGKKVLHLGDHGSGAAVKMAFNMMLAGAMATYGEAVSLGTALGLERSTVAEILLDSPVAAPFLKAKQALISADDFTAHFPLRWMRKDLHLASLAAYEEALALPLLNLTKELYALAEARGLGDEDFAAICKSAHNSS